MLWYWSSRNNF